MPYISQWRWPHSGIDEPNLGESELNARAASRGLTLRQDVHWIVYVNAKMIRDRVQLCLCRGNCLSICILDLIASAIFLKAASDSNTITVRVKLVRFVTSVLESD